MKVPERNAGVGGRVLLKDLAYEELKKLIIEGIFKPGSLLTERELIARLGMSKTPIRSALDRLEGDGFVKSLPQKAVLVQETSIQEIVELFDLRTALEPFVARQLIGRLTLEQRREMEATLQALDKSAEEGDILRNTRLDSEFHIMICTFGGNAKILQVIRGLRDHMDRLVYMNIRSHSEVTLQKIYREHRSIADALVAGKGEEAARLLVDHIKAGRQYLLSP